MKLINCRNCGVEFKPLRVSGVFCSNNCRKLTFKSKVSVPVSVTKKEVSVPQDKLVSVPRVSVPEKQEVSVLRVTKPTGLCHGCRVQQSDSDICICHKCIADKKTHENLGLRMCEV